jgi:hypothetical protein
MSLVEDSNSSQAPSEDDARSGRSLQRNARAASQRQRSRSRSPSEDSIEAHDNNDNNGDLYQMAINSTRAQLDLQKQFLDTLTTFMPPDSPESSKQVVIVDAFRSSLNQLYNLIEDVLRMAEERETAWKKQLEKESEAKRLWEENIQMCAIEQAQMEKVIQENVQEQRRLKRQSRHAFSDGFGASPTIPLTPLSSMAPIMSGSSQSGRRSIDFLEQDAIAADVAESRMGDFPKANLYDSDEEFFDAMDNEEEFPELQITPSPLIEEPSTTLPYIAPSYAGYPSELRTRLPLNGTSLRPEVSLWSILKNSIGKDLSKITLPVYFNEPTSMLQRMAEDMEYSELLDMAAKQRGSTERILYVAAFAMSNYSSTVGRVAKPFNPLLVCPEMQCPGSFISQTLMQSLVG